MKRAPTCCLAAILPLFAIVTAHPADEYPIFTGPG